MREIDFVGRIKGVYLSLGGKWFGMFVIFSFLIWYNWNFLVRNIFPFLVW